MFNTDNLVSSAGLFHQAVLLKEESKLYFIILFFFGTLYPTTSFIYMSIRVHSMLTLKG